MAAANGKKYIVSITPKAIQAKAIGYKIFLMSGLSLSCAADAAQRILIDIAKTKNRMRLYPL